MFSVDSALLIAFIVFASFSAVRWLIRQRRKCFDAFEGTGVPTVPLRSIVNGNSDEYWKPTVLQRLDRWLEEYGDVFGFFIGDTPMVVVKDVDMIHDIFIKNSSNFQSRGRTLHIYEMDPLFKKYIILSKGAVWRESRTCMSHFFTASKLKAVMPSLLHAQQQFIDVLGEHADSGIEADINSLCERFTFDVIGKSAFGIDTNVQRNPEMPMFRAALDVLPNLNSGLFYNLGQNLYHWPWLLKIPAKLIAVLYTNPFADLTKRASDVIRFRRKNPQVHLPDMAQILLDGLAIAESSAEKNNKDQVDNTAPLPPETLNQLSSNCMTVFLGGYDTTRLAFTYWFYLMGKHQDVQEKMREEVISAFEKEGDVLSYQTLLTLPYTNQVISETLRIYPPIITFTSRCPDKDYRYGKYLIKKGTSVMVPTYQLHHDPKYWDYPEKFVPERFSPENKDRINPTVYQPFGLGHRICIGQRLAQVELASATTEVLRHYRIMLGASQKKDLELDTYSYLAVPKEAVRIRLHRLSREK
ncbi:cytochrome P450 3A6 isoform X1 [Rhipicephalus sanguineus]|uniref:cytochrome P450 3A6 isoform X1 n=1 Tax=Rhipicephalus sanguineus TaxID=34632 RepID=UPI001893E216|nr:cytochrome P450 3A6 isoform X1 [Rhipicephalus sanguineus]